MTQQQKESVRWWINLLGPVLTVLILGGTMAVGFGAQGQKLDDAVSRIDKLYDVLIYPHAQKGS